MKWILIKRFIDVDIPGSNYVYVIIVTPLQEHLGVYPRNLRPLPHSLNPTDSWGRPYPGAHFKTKQSGSTVPFKSSQDHVRPHLSYIAGVLSS